MSIPCRLCARQCRTIASATSHFLRAHRDQCPFKCPHAGCRFASTNKEALDWHLENHVPQEVPRPHTCPHCDFRSARPGGILRHVASAHTPRVASVRAAAPRDLTCHVCGSRHASAAALRVHRSVQHRAPTLACPDCAALFRTSLALRAHARAAHDRVYVFVCAHCPRRFRTLQSLRLHTADVAANLVAL